MQITSASNATPYATTPAFQGDGRGFRPILPEDMTLKGLMRRIAEMNLGTTIDFQA
jgi:hypothetical protein